ncbi:MAG: CBS domain-containing protein [Acidimicrobiia bacterium]|nr:CBS domain-containing protein [Acidimicrobiia bacterium]
MPRDTPVAQYMTTDVLSFSPDDNVQEAMQALVDRGIDGAPVVDGSGVVVGLLTTGDLIVQESQLHFPTVLSFLGATLERPSAKKHFDEDIRRALGATVGEVMTADPHTIGEDETLEAAATVMHDHDVSRLPVVRGGLLVGIIARSDIVRAIVTDP